jgi:hypothetical protein
MGAYMREMGPWHVLSPSCLFFSLSLLPDNHEVNIYTLPQLSPMTLCLTNSPETMETADHR